MDRVHIDLKNLLQSDAGYPHRDGIEYINVSIYDIAAGKEERRRETEKEKKLLLTRRVEEAEMKKSKAINSLSRGQLFALTTSLLLFPFNSSFSIIVYTLKGIIKQGIIVVMTLQQRRDITTPLKWVGRKQCPP
jgi:hypothetical protein